MMATNTRVSKTCFIAAPASANLAVLRRLLEERGLQVLLPFDLGDGVDVGADTLKKLGRSDLVVGVLTADRCSPWVLFELGQASALGCRIVLIASPRAEPIPVSMNRFLVLRTEIDNADGLAFALDQILSAPTSSKKNYQPSPPKMLNGLGDKADEFNARLETALGDKHFQGVELLVADALRASGADLVVMSDEKLGADIAVWSDQLDQLVGNPLLVEIKGSLKGATDLSRAMRRLAGHVGSSGSRWGVLLYGAGSGIDEEIVAGAPPNILVLSIRSLLERLRGQAFPDLIRELRNARVHGMR